MTMLVRGGAVAGSALPATASPGQVLQWNGSAWVAATPSASGTTPNATPTIPGLVQLAGDLGGTATAPTVAKINGTAPATVATSGAYTDLTGRPALATVATSGAYTDLTGRPALATVATSGSYGDLTGRPLLATVATSGSYTDLSNRPTIPAAPTAPTVTTSGAFSYWKTAEGVVTVQVSGAPGSGTVSALLFTLPAGYRPTAALTVPMTANSSTTYSAGQLIISTAGAINQDANASNRGGYSLFANFSFVAA